MVAGAHKALEVWARATKNSELAKSAEPDFNVIYWNHRGEQAQQDPTGM